MLIHTRNNSTQIDEIIEFLNDLIPSTLSIVKNGNSDADKFDYVKQAIIEISSLLEETVLTLDDLIETVVQAKIREVLLTNEIIAMGNVIEESEKQVIALTSPPLFDEALEDASIDFMDALAGMGPISVGFNNELIFNEKLSLVKDDIKQMLKLAISTWVRSKSSTI